MKYTGMRGLDGGMSLVMLVTTIYFGYSFYSEWPNRANDVRALDITLLFFWAFIGFFFLYRFIRRSSYAMIQDDGIHIFSRKKEELTFISWESVKMCKQVASNGRFTYLMLVFQFDASYAKRPVALYKEWSRPTYKEVWQHRLDECMGKLSRGKLTEKEFKQIPYLLLAPSKNHLFEYCLTMWEARNSNCRKGEGQGQRDG